MNNEVASAILALQEKALREQRVYQGDILDEALTDLVRNPERTGDAKHLAGSAYANGRTKIYRRSQLAPTVSLDGIVPGANRGRTAQPGEPSTEDREAGIRLEISDVLDRSALSRRDRGYLRLAGLGFTAQEIGAFEGARPATAEVRLSRAQARARDVWSAA